MDERLAGRVAKALERGQALAGRVRKVGPSLWAVPSQSAEGETHLVTGNGRHLDCDCVAAGHGWPCAHRAAVAIWVAFGEQEAPASVASVPARAEAA